MNFICIDTAGKFLQIVGEYEGELFNHIDTSPLQHSVTMMPTIEKMMQNRDWDNIDYLGINIGPGSFTGIRIGVTTIKIFAYLKDIKIIPFNSLEMYAYNISSQSGDTILTAMHSGNANIYLAVYENNFGVLQEIFAPQVLSEKEFETYLNLIDEKIIISSDFELPITKENFVNLRIDFCQAGLRKIMNNFSSSKICDYLKLEPLYIQVSQAEKTYDKKSKN